MKIDTSKIDGYNEMPAEEKLKALEEFELEDKDDEIEKLKADAKKYKDSFDKTASELAALKKEKKGSLSEIEQLKAEHEEQMAELKGKYDELYKESNTNKLVASYVKQGYKEELARKKADAFLSGDTDTVLACEEEFRKDIEKSIKAEVLKGTKKPDDNGDNKEYKTREEIMQIKDSAERQKAIAEHMDMFQ